MTYYIVWNESKREGFITDDLTDAVEAKTGEHGQIGSTLAASFSEIYEEDVRVMCEDKKDWLKQMVSNGWVID